MDKQDEKMIAIVVEIFGVVIVAMGISYEVATGADVGYCIITLGSMLVAGGGLVWGKVVKGFKH